MIRLFRIHAESKLWCFTGVDIKERKIISQHIHLLTIFNDLKVNAPADQVPLRLLEQ